MPYQSVLSKIFVRNNFLLLGICLADVPSNIHKHQPDKNNEQDFTASVAISILLCMATSTTTCLPQKMRTWNIHSSLKTFSGIFPAFYTWFHYQIYFKMFSILIAALVIIINYSGSLEQFFKNGFQFPSIYFLGNQPKGKYFRKCFLPCLAGKTNFQFPFLIQSIRLEFLCFLKYAVIVDFEKNISVWDWTDKMFKFN